MPINIFKIKAKVTHTHNWAMKNLKVYKTPNEQGIFYMEVEKAFVPVGHTINNTYRVISIYALYDTPLKLKERVVGFFGGAGREPDAYRYNLLNIIIK